jgi:hypothetical protein
MITGIRRTLAPVSGGLVLIAGLATSASAQDLAKYARPLIVELRSADTTRAVTFRVAREGAFLATVGASAPAAHPPHAGGGIVEGTTPAILEFADAAGWVLLTADRSGPALVLFIRAADQSRTESFARGHAIRVESDAEGRIRVSSEAMRERPTGPRSGTRAVPPLRARGDP